jgi:LytS/YehU family sensor histidine kinase
MAALIRVPLASFLNAHYFLVGKPQPGRSDLFVSSFINVFIWTAIITSAKLIYDHFRFEESLVLLKKEKSKVEFDLLNAQMNPHFLFNSLNTIYAEIDGHNSTARNMILSFSNILRYQLYDCNHQLVQIRNELAYIENYVALQRARMESDVDVLLTIEEQLGNFNIAPLLFTSFIENAFKYEGPSELYGNKIEISISKIKGGLLFRCFNTKDPLRRSMKEGGGIGLSNVKKRLSLHYPDKHDLQIRDHEQYFLVELIFEANEMEMHYR